MRLSDFFDKKVSELDDFCEFWERQNAAHPEGFPFDMNDGDWDEQLQIYIECVRDTTT